ncbi:hypothetical protein PR048_003733 [Dryococelus australis]|uniref:Uncharacterized protein n=1 Tax=Dryococelus australis TaxID=614101 RepID=A0ABQ9IQL6_9NEOP|nr:hypothetical protein PR048_003733 [Dryococelus australis]
MSENVGSNKPENNTKSREDVADIKDHRVFIETILVEMKSEFNRNLVIEEDETAKGGKKVDVSKCEKSGWKNDAADVKSEKKCKPEKDKKVKDLGTRETEVPDCDKQIDVENDDDKNKTEVPNVIKEINMEGEDHENSKNVESSPGNEKCCQLSEAVMKVPLPKKGKPKVVDQISNKISESSGEDVASTGQPETPNGKRSLRSQTLVKTPPNSEEPVGVKRSARRRSKDSPRESVLQSAIARKAKSFSNLNRSEEKSISKNIRPRIHRSPRMSSGERVQPLNRSSGIMQTRSSSSENVAKPPVSKVPKAPVMDAVDASNSKPDVVLDHSDSHIEAPSGVDPVDISVKNNSDPCSKSPLQAVAVSGQSYTKTGKRRYKPYRGLRYSFTSGPVKKNKFSKRQSKNSPDNEEIPNTGRSESETAVHSENEVKLEQSEDASNLRQDVVAAAGAGSQMEVHSGTLKFDRLQIFSYSSDLPYNRATVFFMWGDIL